MSQDQKKNLFFTLLETELRVRQFTKSGRATTKWEEGTEAVRG